MKKKKTKKESLIELKSTQSNSPILGVKDGVIVTKDGRFVKLLEFSPINFELRSPAEQDEIIMQFSAALRTMPDTVHLKVINTPSDISPFIDGLIEKMREEENPGVQDLQYDQMELIYRIKSTQGVSRRFFLSYEYESQSKISKKPSFQLAASVLNRQAKSIAMSMETCGNSLISDDSPDYILSVLYNVMCKQQSRLTPFAEHKAQIIKKYKEKFGDNILEEQIPINDFIAPSRVDFTVSIRYAIIDGKYTMYCFVPTTAYPTRALGGWTQVMFSNFDGIDLDLWIKKEDPAHVMRRLTYELKTNRIREKNTDDVAANYEDIQSALTGGYFIKNSIASGDDFCYISTLITITGDTVEEMTLKYKEILDHMIRNDMSLKQCFFQQEEAYNATLPLASYSEGLFKKSKRNTVGSQLGSCYPFTAYELADEGGIFFGTNASYGTPVFINIFDRSKYQNANMLILGPSGSGKTYTLLSMLLRMRQQGLQIYTIAPFKGSEFRRACNAVGGEFIRIAPGSVQNINIMEIRKYDSEAVYIDDEERKPSGSILTDKIQQISRFFALLIPDISIQERHLLDEALIKTYHKFGITVQNESLADPKNPDAYKEMPILGDLMDELEMQRSDGLKTDRMIEALSRYVTGSARSFNQPTNVNLANKFVVLDVSDMTAEMLPVGMFIALDYVLDAAKADKTKNKVIAIDELWRLMVASKLTAEFAVEVFKIIRGYGGSAIGATQDLDDVLKDEYGAAIINNAKIKFFLPMERKEAEAVAQIVDITSEELKNMKISKAMKPGQDRKILMVAGANHVFISVKTSKREHDLITTSADDLRRLAREKAAAASSLQGEGR